MRPLGSRNAPSGLPDLGKQFTLRLWAWLHFRRCAAFQAVRCISGGAMAIESLPKRLPASQGSGMEVLC
jgi:hypothetical protein